MTSAPAARMTGGQPIAASAPRSAARSVRVVLAPGLLFRGRCHAAAMSLYRSAGRGVDGPRRPGRTGVLPPTARFAQDRPAIVARYGPRS